MNTTATAAAHEATTSSAPRRRLRILLVEDDPSDRDLIMRELRNCEFDITSDVAVTAQEFRENVRTNCPDVVLAGYKLGQWRGWMRWRFCVKKVWTSRSSFSRGLRCLREMSPR